MFTKNDRKIVRCEYDKSSCTIEGLAVTPKINSNKQSFNPLGCELSVPIPLLFEHDQKVGSIGEVVYARKSETGVCIRATIFPDEEGYAVWSLVKEGLLTGLSVGIGYGRGQFHILEMDGIDYFTKFKFAEVSVCFDPANKDCRFRIFPGGGKKMVHPTVAKAREILRTPPKRSLSDAERLARMSPQSRELLLKLRRHGVKSSRDL
jgi:HK97 family phage prohead protease